jgi:hypothetical protein
VYEVGRYGSLWFVLIEIGHIGVEYIDIIDRFAVDRLGGGEEYFECLFSAIRGLMSEFLEERILDSFWSLGEATISNE